MANSVIAGSARSTSPLTIAYENVQTVGKNLQTKCLGPNFEVLDRVPSSPEPAHYDGLCTRLKELVDESTDPEKDAKKRKINAVLVGVIFKSPAAPKQTSSQQAPTPELQTEKPTDAGDGKGEGTRLSDYKNLTHATFFDARNYDSTLDMVTEKGTSMVKTASEILTFIEPTLSAQKQLILSSILFCHESCFVLESAIHAELAKLFFVPNFINSQDSSNKIDASLMKFEFNPSTTEGMAFLCHWAKILKAESNSFSIFDSSQYSLQYYNELKNICAQNNGEIQAMANRLCAMMELGLLPEEIIRNGAVLEKQGDLLKNAMDPTVAPKVSSLIAIYGHWVLLMPLWSQRTNLPVKERKRLLQRFSDCLHFYQQKYVDIYRTTYDELMAQSRASKSKLAFELKYCRRLIETSFGLAKTEFPSPSLFNTRFYKDRSPELVIRRILKNPVRNPVFISDLHESKANGTKSSGKKRVKEGDEKQKSPSSSPPKTTSSTIASSSLGPKSSISVDEPKEAETQKASSPKSLPVSDLIDRNSFSALDLDSPKISAGFSFDSSSPSAKRASTKKNPSPSAKDTSNTAFSSSISQEADLSPRSTLDSAPPKNAAPKRKTSSPSHTPTASPPKISPTFAKLKPSANKPNSSSALVAAPIIPASIPKDSRADSKENRPASPSTSVSAPQRASTPPRPAAERVFEGSLGTLDLHERVVKQKAQGDWRHAFSDFVDLFLGTKYCRSVQRFDDTTREMQPYYQIYGEVEVGNQKKHVIFEYTFNQQNQCYHRFAPDISKREFITAIVRDIQHTTQNPTPSESLRVGSPPEEVVLTRNDQQYKFIVSQPYDIVSYTDAKGIKYKLFKMQ